MTRPVTNMPRSSSIFRSPAARERMQALYDRFLDRLGPPAERRTVATRHGSTHVLVYGPPDAPPLVCLHGALAGAPHALGELRALIEHYRVYAPDIVGQSVMSAEVRPPFTAEGFGGWARDVMDGLELPRAHVLGVSWGGAVAMQLAMHAPERIDRLVLLVPAGMVKGSAWRGVVEVGWPMLKWRLRPTQGNLEAMLSATFTTLDPLWVEFMGEAFGAVKIDFKAPPRVQPEDFAGFDRPTLVIAAEHDLSFPGAALLERAREVFGAGVETRLVEGSKHCPPFTAEFRGWLGEQVGGFLSARSGACGTLAADHGATSKGDPRLVEAQAPVPRSTS